MPNNKITITVKATKQCMVCGAIANKSNPKGIKNPDFFFRCQCETPDIKLVTDTKEIEIPAPPVVS